MTEISYHFYVICQKGGCIYLKNDISDTWLETTIEDYECPIKYRFIYKINNSKAHGYEESLEVKWKQKYRTLRSHNSHSVICRGDLIDNLGSSKIAL